LLRQLTSQETKPSAQIAEKLDKKPVTSGVEFAQTKLDFLHYHRTVFYSPLKSKVGNILAKATAFTPHTLNSSFSF
jgi:hypothetical protein